MYVHRGFEVGYILERVLQRNLPELCTYDTCLYPSPSLVIAFLQVLATAPTVGLHRASECINETCDYVHSSSLSQA